MKRKALIALFTLTMTAAMITGCGNRPDQNLAAENSQESPAEAGGGSGEEASDAAESNTEEAGDEAALGIEGESGDGTASGIEGESRDGTASGIEGESSDEAASGAEGDNGDEAGSGTADGIGSETGSSRDVTGQGESTQETSREESRDTGQGESQETPGDLEAPKPDGPNASIDGTSRKEGTPAPAEAGSQTPDYTVTAMNTVMYVINAVNLRQGPGTDYSRVGSLSKGDQVTVIGQADNGWFQLDSGAFVSNRYLGGEAPVATPADTAATGLPADPAAALPVTVPVTTVSTGTDFLNILNQQRSAAGLGTLLWDDGMAAVAQRRAQEITKVLDHSGNVEQYGEIIQRAISGDATEWYTNWYNSDAHRSSMMAKNYTRAGVGVYNIGTNYYVVCNFEGNSISEEELLEQHKPENLIPAGGNENGTVNGFSTTGETLDPDDPDYGFIYDLIEQEREQYNQ
ncbi:MAG: SH3 domain-containing protein [Lachnospiraceae bacterium]|nr:SH3 domain-containing protein [Lachnospiraceae bacterium]